MSKAEIKTAVNEVLYEREILARLFGTDNAKSTIKEQCRKVFEQHQRDWKLDTAQATKLQCEKQYQEWERKMECTLSETAQKEVKVHFRDFVDNSVQVNSVLRAHETYMTGVLQQTADTVLESTRNVMFQIVSDPQHNEVVNTHLRYVSEQTERELKACRDSVQTTLSRSKQNTENLLTQIKYDYEEQIKDLKAQLARLEEVRDLASETKAEQTKLWYAVMFTNLGLLAVGCCLFFKR